MAALVYLSMSSMDPAYLAADCQLVSNEGRRQLRSANLRTYSSYGDTCFVLQVLGCGTTFQFIRDKLTLALNSLSGC